MKPSHYRRTVERDEKISKFQVALYYYMYHHAWYTCDDNNTTGTSTLTKIELQFTPRLSP